MAAVRVGESISGVGALIYGDLIQLYVQLHRPATQQSQQTVLPGGGTKEHIYNVTQYSCANGTYTRAQNSLPTAVQDLSSSPSVAAVIVKLN